MRLASSSGGQKLQMPLLQSANIWKQTGRWDSSGPEVRSPSPILLLVEVALLTCEGSSPRQLFRLKDRRGADLCLAPTHEELITQIFANESMSYRHLPLLLYQIGEFASLFSTYLSD